MSMYKVALIREGREYDYRDFWHSGTQTNQRGEVLNSEIVGIYVHIEAKNLEDAIAMARKKYPKLTVAREHCAKLG